MPLDRMYRLPFLVVVKNLLSFPVAFFPRSFLSIFIYQGLIMWARVNLPQHKTTIAVQDMALEYDTLVTAYDISKFATMVVY